MHVVISGQTDLYIFTFSFPGRDKLKRSPLMHAVINGQTAVASFLLHAGVSIDHVDSSGNSALLYAVAYGWSVPENERRNGNY